MKETLKYPMKVYNALLNSLNCASLMMACNDYLRTTTAYRHDLKRVLNLTEPVLTKMIDDDLGQLWGVDDAAMYNLQDGLQNFIEQMDIRKFATLRPEQLAGVGELLRKFHENPEQVLEQNEILIVESLEAA
jgi:hypothetical protein